MRCFQKKYLLFIPVIVSLVVIVFASSKRPEKNEGCSSWLILRSSSQLKQLILHKNRDKGSAAQQVVTAVTDGTFDFIGTKSDGDNYCNAGINEAGLAVAYNYAAGGSGIGWSTTKFVENILKNNGTVEDAYDYIKSNYGKVSGAGIILIAGPRETPLGDVTCGGAVVEYMPSIIPGYKYRISSETKSLMNTTEISRAVTNHFCVVAYPPLWDDSTGTLYRKSVVEQGFASYGNDAEENVKTTFGLSRNMYLCNYDGDDEFPSSDEVTLSGVTFVIDVTDPAEKSCMWAALGSPDVSLYTPFHVDSMGSLSEYWSAPVVYEFSEDLKALNNYIKEVSIPSLESFEESVVGEAMALTGGFSAWDTEKWQDIYYEMCFLSGNECD